MSIVITGEDVLGVAFYPLLSFKPATHDIYFDEQVEDADAYIKVSTVSRLFRVFKVSIEVDDLKTSCYALGRSATAGQVLNYMAMAMARLSFCGVDE